MPRLTDIQIRDPFILAEADRATYYLYGTTDTNPWEGAGVGFDCYRSRDLDTWEGPFLAFRPHSGFWGTTQFWAPEVHQYRGAFYMFATFAGDSGQRGTQVLVASDPLCPFEPWSDGPVTPAGWKCLDGTLFVDRDRSPWIVFCHEWLQVGDGSIVAQRLSTDLRTAIGEPRALFHASAAPWTRPVQTSPAAAGEQSYVTDGPFIIRVRDGGLNLLWSSNGDDGYAMGVARSASGELFGEWTHDPDPLWANDGGHGMIVDAFDGRRLLVFHEPNDLPNERARLHEVVESDGWIVLAPDRQPRTQPYAHAGGVRSRWSDGWRPPGPRTGS